VIELAQIQSKPGSRVRRRVELLRLRCKFCIQRCNKLMSSVILCNNASANQDFQGDSSLASKSRELLSLQGNV
jgi:hypothetical protein